MGRDVAGLRLDKEPITVDAKSNGTNHDMAHDSPKKTETEDDEPQDQKQDFADTENTNNVTEEKIIKAESDDSDEHSPNTTSTSQTNSRTDEDDNCSIDSSYSATSVRSNKFRVTVPVAPKFTCQERLEKRKEYYAKLEEKHKALEREKLELEAKKKEEEQEAIKQLRKSMVYKANPIPSFYREGPPRKVELKKPPVTRAKSPKLTRRRSCGDAGKHSAYEGLNEQGNQHSTSSHKEGKSCGSTAAKGKIRMAMRKSNESSRGKGNPDQEDENADNEVES